MKNELVKQLISIIPIDSYITAETLAKKLKISEKTVRIKIKELNKELEKMDIKIDSKSGLGYILINRNNFKLNNFSLNMTNNLEYRIISIFEYLINNNDEYIKADYLCDSLSISKTTLTNTLKIIENNIFYNNLRLERRPNYGIKLIGDEFYIRNCIIEYYLKMCIFEEKYDKELIEKVSSIVVKFTKKHHLKLSEINLENFIQYICVSIIRIGNKKLIEKFDKKILKDIRKEELKLAGLLAKKLEKEYKIKFNYAELIFITLHIISKNLLIYNENQNFIIQNKMSVMVNEMIETIYNNLKIDFRNDFNLRLLLNQHMTPMDIRLRYNILHKNPMLKDIKENYSLAYLIATEANSVLKKYYNKEIPDDEIGFLALLFEISLEEKKEKISKLNILIVCGSGKTTSKLLMCKYKKEFSKYIDNIYATDLINLKDFDFRKVNYVFSTVPITLRIPIPIVYIGLFLETNDIIKVKKALALSENDFIYKYYRKEFFSSKIKGKSKEEVIENICKEIKKYENIPDNFYESILKREESAETDFGNLVAIPHPFEVLTKNTFVYVAVLKEPIFWHKNNVQVVFLVSISDERDNNLIDFYQYTVVFLLNEESVKKLIENKTFENLILLLRNKE